jgi:hypothetical protein
MVREMGSESIVVATRTLTPLWIPLAPAPEDAPID